MKINLVLIRHGKAEEGNMDLKDFDRALMPKGYMQAEFVGQALKSKNIQPNYIICSSAKRTVETAHVISKILDYKVSEISCLDKLYLCSHEIFDDVLAELQETFTGQTIIVVGHNPGISDYINIKSNSIVYHNLKTCGFAILTIQLSDWATIFNAKATLKYIINH